LKTDLEKAGCEWIDARENMKPGAKYFE